MEWKYSGGIHSGGSSIYHNASGRKKVLAEYEKITVCVTIDDLPKGESITEDNILNYVQTVEIDRKIVPDTAIKNMDEITGRIAVHRIEKGSVVTRGCWKVKNRLPKRWKKL